MTRDDLVVAAGHSVDPARWAGVLDELMTRAGTRFRRAEPGRRARAFVLGLMAELPRTNCRTIAEHAGDATPDGMQHLLARARGTQTACGMTCAAMLRSTWAIRRPCWWPARPVT